VRSPSFFGFYKGFCAQSSDTDTRMKKMWVMTRTDVGCYKARSRHNGQAGSLPYAFYALDRCQPRIGMVSRHSCRDRAHGDGLIFPICPENHACDFKDVKLTGFQAAKRHHRPQQCLYFLPLPQGQGSLRPTFGPVRTGLAFSATAAASIPNKKKPEAFASSL